MKYLDLALLLVELRLIALDYPFIFQPSSILSVSPWLHTSAIQKYGRQFELYPLAMEIIQASQD